MGGRDQSQVKIKFKKFEKVKSVPKDVPKSHNDDSVPPRVQEGGVSNVQKFVASKFGLWVSFKITRISKTQLHKRDRWNGR